MSDIDRFDLLFFIYETQRATASEGLRFKELMEFCNCDPQGARKPSKCSYRTLMNYKKELMAEDLLKKRINTESGRPVYYVPTEQNDYVEKLIAKRDIYDLSESFDIKWLRILRRLLANIREEGMNPEEFFDRNCLAFVGGVSYNFEKSLYGIKRALLFESRLADLAAKHGVTKEEYFREMVEHVTKQPKGMRRILAYLQYMGVTEAQIKELLEKQGGTWEVTHYSRKKR